MNKRYFFLTLLVLIAVPKKVLAHGANIEYRETSAITIQAKYDDDTPMAHAQVVIYAPSDRTTPWLKGTTDESGNFTFVPDAEPNNVGDWDVKVRQSGHGDITTIPVTGSKLAQNVTDTQLSATGAGYTSMQKAVMAVSSIWGFVGTALFFSRSKSYK
ncbi:MAG: carboxypeptidase regulatory-like domain-containing protein [Pleurocapsa sp. MO_192.B19]|nr:carboxypeptidase regulatory-like domain-containing protein [Pleurocapsa sp. MO_192.B19]